MSMRNRKIILVIILIISAFLYADSPQFILIEGGEFDMGDIWENSKGFGSDEFPIHKVKLNSFYMSKYEVTHAEYIKFLNSEEVAADGSFHGNQLFEMKAENCAIAHNGTKFYYKGSKYIASKQSPVIYVSWYGAVEYCNWKSEQEGLKKAYQIAQGSVDCNFSATGYRLPTEAEWEYAARCRGRTDRKYSGTDTKSELEEYCWYGQNIYNQSIQETGAKKPNDLGLYDMSGNVWEWCWDWYSRSYYSNSPKYNPTGPSTGEYHVLRGGDFDSSAKMCRSTNRNHFDTSTKYNYYGFRPVRSK